MSYRGCTKNARRSIVCSLDNPLPDGSLLIYLPDKAKSIIRNYQAQAEIITSTQELIPKPAGRRSRDFTIFVAMQGDGKAKVSKDMYINLQVSGSAQWWFPFMLTVGSRRTSKMPFS